MRDDDLFAGTSMSFGDHLEELRLCFIRSIFAIVIGTLAGFAVGKNVVQAVQIPVQRALGPYHEKQATHKFDAEADILLKEGYSHEIKQYMKKYGLIPEERWFLPGELERILDQQRISADASLTTFDIDDMDNLLLRKLERRKKREEVGLIHTSVQFDKPPIRFFQFRKTEELSKMKALGPYEMFRLYLLASIMVGLVMSSPFVIYYLWSFVAAGLYPHEKKYVYYFIPISVGLFIGGAYFAFFHVFRFVLDFLFFFNAWMDVEPDLRISEWINFALLFPLGFGISFQLPLVLFVLERVGIFTLAQYISRWKISVLVIFILALLLTPGDPGSMLLMAIPLTILYFAGIFFCWLIPRKRGLFDIDPEDVVAEGA
ncbi:MAG: twin-arginine translocase subunit TatC [Planctomycetaceae bacterium]|jgi:sec-independent protein translocase protein TatC|nr:twin-arginine translocase subunit TatC [Planctomycetaceae bacterium]